MSRRYFWSANLFLFFCLSGASLERQPDPLGAMTWLQDQLLDSAIFIKQMTSNSIWYSITYGSALQHMKIYHKSDSVQFDDNYSCNTYTYSKVQVQMINPLHLPLLSCRLGCASLKKKSTGWSGLQETEILSQECWMMIRTQDLFLLCCPTSCQTIKGYQRYFTQTWARNSFFPNCWMAIS